MNLAGSLLALGALSLVSADIEYDDGVLVLTEENFEEALGKHSALLVVFYTPWCAGCDALEHEFEKAAGILRKEGREIGLAEVNARKEDDLASEFGVSKFPTILLFEDGSRKNPLEYTGAKESDDIITWVKEQSGDEEQGEKKHQVIKEARYDDDADENDADDKDRDDDEDDDDDDNDDTGKKIKSVKFHEGHEDAADDDGDAADDNGDAADDENGGKGTNEGRKEEL